MSTQQTLPEENTLHVGCGENTKPNAHNVDVLDLPGVDETHDLENFPWPWPNESFSKIIGEHVFEHLEDIEGALRECERILKPSGELKVVMPVGQNAWTDPDHKHRWNWDTPEMYCGARPWDVDIGLEVVDKDAYVRTHFDGPINPIYGGFLRVWKVWEGPGRWMFDMPATSGEFTVVFEKP